jgi:hypothetical protein
MALLLPFAAAIHVLQSRVVPVPQEICNLYVDYGPFMCVRRKFLGRQCSLVGIGPAGQL